MRLAALLAFLAAAATGQVPEKPGLQRAFTEALNAVTAVTPVTPVTLDTGLELARLLRFARPSLARQALEHTVAVSPANRHDTLIRYYTSTREWDQAIKAAIKAKEAGLVTLRSTQALLDKLYPVEPRKAADLFGTLLSELPATLTDRRDLLFTARNMRAVASIDPAIARTAADRIQGSLEPDTVRLPEKKLLLAAAAGAKVVLPELDKPAVSPAPDLAAFRRTLQETLEAELPIAADRGHVVLVNFWESWCAPCIREMPRLENAAARNGFVLHKVTARPDLSQAYEVVELPVTLVFNQEGILIARLTGEQTEASLLRAVSGE